MKILAIDTATEILGVAVMVDGSVRVETIINRRETHSRNLMTAIFHTLEKAGMLVFQLDGFAVTAGPGSFTGLRIGISTIKGMACAARKQVAMVSTLDALAHSLAFAPVPVCAMIDARKKEVYTATYRINDLLPARIDEERVESPEIMVSRIETPHIFIGNGAIVYKELIRQRLKENAIFAPAHFHDIRPGVVANIGSELFRQNRVHDAKDVVPVYLRPSDARLGK